MKRKTIDNRVVRAFLSISLILMLSGFYLLYDGVKKMESLKSPSFSQHSNTVKNTCKLAKVINAETEIIYALVVIVWNLMFSILFTMLLIKDTSTSKQKFVVKMRL